ncbi:hypothetical protein [uncultured Pantoea sp.]|uniref:hypothetical protein n=1 Tax=uncultured Pantoea sp. TaxID=218084 RepID=UPI002588D568|nr:hypothetical protein [uncultured Pantoea sp.]
MISRTRHARFINASSGLNIIPRRVSLAGRGVVHYAKQSALFIAWPRTTSSGCRKAGRIRRDPVRPEIQTLQPQPQVAETIGSDLRLTFSAAGTGPYHAILIGLQPRHAGRIHVAIHGGGAAPVRFTQWIYP